MTPGGPADDDLPADVVLVVSALVGSVDVSDPAAVGHRGQLMARLALQSSP